MLRNKLIYMCLLVYGVIFIILYNNYVTMFLVIVLCCMPLLLWVVLALTVPFVGVALLEPTATVEKNEDFKVSLVLRNKSIFPVAQGKIRLTYYNWFGKEKNNENITIFVGSRSEQTASCTMSAACCGNIVVCCDYIRIYDYFRIFSIKKKINKKIKISIMPGLDEILLELPQKLEGELFEGDSFSKVKSGDDPSEVFDIREYHIGDKIHRMHWKLSSKKKQYMVKEYSLPIGINAAILLDFYNNKKDAVKVTDSMIEIAASLSYTLMIKGYTHYFAWYDSVREEVRRIRIENEEDLYILLEDLFTASPYKEEDLFSAAYGTTFGAGQVPQYYYVGQGNIAGFEEYDIRPEVIAVHG